MIKLFSAIGPVNLEVKGINISKHDGDIANILHDVNQRFPVAKDNFPKNSKYQNIKLENFSDSSHDILMMNLSKAPIDQKILDVIRYSIIGSTPNPSPYMLCFRYPGYLNRPFLVSCTGFFDIILFYHSMHAHIEFFRMESEEDANDYNLMFDFIRSKYINNFFLPCLIDHISMLNNTMADEILFKVAHAGAFALAHEYGHLILEHDLRADPSSDIEFEADEIATSLFPDKNIALASAIWFFLAFDAFYNFGFDPEKTHPRSSLRLSRIYDLCKSNRLHSRVENMYSLAMDRLSKLDAVFGSQQLIMCDACLSVNGGTVEKICRETFFLLKSTYGKNGFRLMCTNKEESDIGKSIYDEGVKFSKINSQDDYEIYSSKIYKFINRLHARKN